MGICGLELGIDIFESILGILEIVKPLAVPHVITDESDVNLIVTNIKELPLQENLMVSEAAISEFDSINLNPLNLLAFVVQSQLEPDVAQIEFHSHMTLVIVSSLKQSQSQLIVNVREDLRSLESFRSLESTLLLMVWVDEVILHLFHFLWCVLCRLDVVKEGVSESSGGCKPSYDF